MATSPARDPATDHAQQAQAGSSSTTASAGVSARRLRWLGGDTLEQVIALVCLGALIEICLVVLTHRFRLSHWYPGPGVSVGFPQMMTGVPGADSKWYAFVTAAPFFAFVPAVFYCRGLSGPLARGVVFGYAALFGLTLVPLYPIAAADLFHYVADARTLWVYHQNPMLVSPDKHPFFIGISWAQQPSPYGPFWQLLAIAPIALAGGAVASVIAFKLFALGFFLLAAVFVYLTVRRLFPGRELLATLAFAWNPFVTFRAIGNGHNDIAMMAFALAAFYCLSRRAWRWALPLLALSVCIKYATLIVVPPVLLYAWLATDARERREVIYGLGISLAVTVAVFAPFWQGLDTFKTFIQNTNLQITALPELLSLQLQPGHAPAAADRIAKALGYAAFGPIYLCLLYAVFRRRTLETLIAVSGLAFIAYLSFCTWWFRPWYFLWFLALVALLPSPYWLGLSIATSFGATFFDMIEQYRPNWHWIWSDSFRGYAAPVLSAFLPLLLFVAAGGLILLWHAADDPARGRTPQTANDSS